MKRWVFYTNEVAKVGHCGPFGPFEASSIQMARKVAAARAASSRLTVREVRRVDHNPNA